MEYMTPNFTKDMVKTHKILIPNMAVTQFRLLQAALECEGYNVEVLGNCGSEVAQLGLKYVHNDTCYPALLVIGQFIDALNSGKYDLDHTALLITQTGGGCRASNYIKLLRKALVKAGYGNIPVASLNFSGLEKGSGLPLTLPLIRKVIACIYYGDLLVALRSQTKPYENKPGSADALTEKWIATIQSWMHKSINYNVHDMKRQFAVICASYASVPVTRVPKVKVGVVGEIYVKYSPLGNNDLEKFLESQDCEVNLPGLMGFVEYCVANMTLDVELYGGSKVKAMATDKLLDWMDSIGCAMNDAMRKSGFYAPGSFRELMEKPKGIISLGAKMGEGWLLTAEMIELVQGGYGNIVCAQPFGCLPNHIVGKGMIRKLKDGNGAYLWQPSVQAGQPDRLLGYELYTSPYVPVVAGGAFTVAFGDFKNYWIGDRAGRTVQRLNELYATNGQIGYVATERVDGKVILSEGIQLLKMKA